MTDDLKIIELQELLDNANSQYKTVSAEAGRYKLLAEKLEQQLAECQAALQLRDKVLRVFRDSVLFRIGSSSPYRSLAEDYFEQIKETIAIQPGTEALEKLWGEPVGFVASGELEESKRKQQSANVQQLERFAELVAAAIRSRGTSTNSPQD